MQSELVDAAEVSLVFPPTARTAFGSYYPSTAVLAGFLRARGIGSQQVDLNHAFVRDLLDPTRLEALARGQLPGGPQLDDDSHVLSAARLLAHQDGGRLLLTDDPESLGFLVDGLVSPFEIDGPVPKLLADLRGNAWWPGFYARFFAASSYAETLPMSIHTVGLSVALPAQLGPALVLARRVKNVRPHVRVILGGASISFLRADEAASLLAAIPELDAMVRFEGEIPLGILIDQQRAGGWCPERVPGVIARGPAGCIDTPPAPGVTLDQAPYPEFDPAILSRLGPSAELKIIQARGCYWGRCAYCSFVELYCGNQRYRSRTAASFVDELERQSRKYGLRRFQFVTESLAPPFARQMCQAILARQLDIRWSAFVMADRLFTPELFALMARAGCERVVAGIETMTGRVLRLMDKHASVEENARLIREARAAGLSVHVNLIPDLPSTTYEEACASLAMVQELADNIDGVSVCPFLPILTSKVGREPGRFGLAALNPREIADWACGPRAGFNQAAVVDPAMTPEQHEEVCDAFAAFSDRIRLRGHLKSMGLAESAETTRCRFAAKFIAWRQFEDRIELANGLTREILEMEVSWREALAYLDATPLFEAAEFSARFDATGELLSALRENHLVLPAP